MPDGVDASSFDFLFGRWQVRHRKLYRRLSASTSWVTFDGTCESRPILGGMGNVDDNFLEDPNGAYRAVTLRRFDPLRTEWSIWWLDARTAGIDPPVRGRFDHGVGTFVGDDIFESRPIIVRYLWTGIAEGQARWEQAFSADTGLTWETNWIMQFERET